MFLCVLFQFMEMLPSSHNTHTQHAHTHTHTFFLSCFLKWNETHDSYRGIYSWFSTQARHDLTLYSTLKRRETTTAGQWLTVKGDSENTLLNTILTVHRGHEESQSIITISNTYFDVNIVYYLLQIQNGATHEDWEGEGGEEVRDSRKDPVN